MNDADFAALLARVRAGDAEAAEDLLAAAAAPTFDAAAILWSDAARATSAAESALAALLERAAAGGFAGGDPLRETGRALATAARAEGVQPFAEGLSAAELAFLGRPPQDPRGREIAALAAEDALALTLERALELAPPDLAYALDRAPGAAAEALERAFRSVPHADPRSALRDVFDLRASAHRLPPGLTDRVLERAGLA